MIGSLTKVSFDSQALRTLGFRFQRAHLARKYQCPATASQSRTVEQTVESTYELSTQLTDHFEVVERLRLRSLSAVAMFLEEPEPLGLGWLVHHQCGCRSRARQGSAGAQELLL